MLIGMKELNECIEWRFIKRFRSTCLHFKLRRRFFEIELQLEEEADDDGYDCVGEFLALTRPSSDN